MYFKHVSQGIEIETGPAHVRFLVEKVALTHDLFQEHRFFFPFKIMLLHIRVSFICQRRYTTLPHDSLVKHSDSYFSIKIVININLKKEIKGINNIEKYKIKKKAKLNY
jgi:hypothetical protein